MYDRDTLIAIGRSAAAAVRTRDKWIHRYVEAVTFPRPDARVYRRNISIDFTIPQITPVPNSDPARYYVPLSLLRKWPPLLRLDLRTGGGDPIPLLTARQNGIVDCALLTALAQAALISKGLHLTSEIEELIEKLAKSRGDEASKALVSLVPPDILGHADAPYQALREDTTFADVAGGLRDSSVLWLRVQGAPGDREIVKFSYDIPLTWRVQGLAQSFGFKPFTARFETPHIGGSGSYHLIISTPAPLKVSDAQLVISEARTAEGQPQEEQVVAVCNADQEEAEEQLAQNKLRLYVKRLGREGRFYITGDRAGAHGEAWIALLSEKRGFLRAAAWSASCVAVLVSAYFAVLGRVLRHTDVAVTVLLLAPALLAYLVVRPSQHILVGQFLSGARTTLLLSGALPIVGAAAIAVNGEDWTCGLKICFGVLALAAWLATFVLSATVLLPRENDKRPLSRTNSSS